MVRLGVGPSLRRTELTWGRGSCGCHEVQESSSLTPGVAADLVFTLPARARGVLEVRLQSRYYAPSSVPEYTHSSGGGAQYTIPSLDRDPFSFSGALLLGVRL